MVVPTTTKVVSFNPAHGVLDTTLYNKACQSLATGRWFSPDTPITSTNNSHHHYIAEIVLKVTLNTITLTLILF